MRIQFGSQEHIFKLTVGGARHLQEHFKMPFPKFTETLLGDEWLIEHVMEVLFVGLRDGEGLQDSRANEIIAAASNAPSFAFASAVELARGLLLQWYAGVKDDPVGKPVMANPPTPTPPLSSAPTIKRVRQSGSHPKK